jgi:hypothetical protein
VLAVLAVTVYTGKAAVALEQTLFLVVSQPPVAVAVEREKVKGLVLAARAAVAAAPVVVLRGFLGKVTTAVMVAVRQAILSVAAAAVVAQGVTLPVTAVRV